MKKPFILSLFFSLISVWSFSQISTNCPSPQQPVVNYTTTTSALVSWDNQSATDLYRVELYEVSSNTLIHVNNSVTTPQYLFTNLQANTTYKALIYRWCGTGKNAKLSPPSEVIIKTVIEDIVIWVSDPNNPTYAPRNIKLPDLCRARCKVTNQNIPSNPNPYHLSLSENNFLTVELNSASSNRQYYYVKFNIGYDVFADKLVICGQEANDSIQTSLSADKKTMYIQSRGATIFAIQYCCSRINAQRLKIVEFDILPQQTMSLSTCVSPNPSYAEAVPVDDSALIRARNASATYPNHSLIEWTIHPNPIHETAVLDLALNQTCTVQLRFYNVQGQIVYQQNLGQLFKGFNQIELKTDEILRGLYFVEITTSDTRTIRKIVKQ